MATSAASWVDYDKSTPVPAGPIELGSCEHLTLLCRTLLDTHDPYKPAVLDWPKLDPDTGVQDQIPSDLGRSSRGGGKGRPECPDLR
jgi:hypothetical protein